MEVRLCCTNPLIWAQLGEKCAGSLQWHTLNVMGVSDHQQLDCLLKSSFRLRTRHCTTGPMWGESGMRWILIHRWQLEKHSNDLDCVRIAINFPWPHECIDGLMQERCNSIANALELRLSCTNPSAWSVSSSIESQIEHCWKWPNCLACPAWSKLMAAYILYVNC